MKILKILTFALLMTTYVSLLGCAVTVPHTLDEQTTNLPNPDELLHTMERVANWQLPRLEHLDYLSFKREESELPRGWVQGAFYKGLTKLAERSENPIYEKWIGFKGNEWDWVLGNTYYFGDDHLIGQTYLWYYERHKDPRVILALRDAFDRIIEKAPDNSLEFIEALNDDGLYTCQWRWCWADALYMSPPAWFAMSEATGDPRYADYAHQEFQATIDYLYDEKTGLVFRDSRFKTMTGEFGEPMFWSRGGGWVFGGIIHSIDALPVGHPYRQYYIDLYKKMAKTLAALQKQDGSWAMSLLAGEKMPQPETSGTAFYTYGLAWGVKHGFLNRETYLPRVLNGWRVLNAAIHPSGKLGWVQGIGAAPGSVSYEDSQLYGVGAFLLAGAMMYDLASE